MAAPANDRQLLLDYNKMRETNCLIEGTNESTWLRPQRRHYPQSNCSSEENYRKEKHKYVSDRTSWIKITPPKNREKRHFPEKNHAILDDLFLDSYVPA
ncbi:spermatogenesis-associated protein 45 [Hemicordylus capensis]|uniref:spermatogenesis-associated protein 45 n=1 Tax=Hemicordylus capensis TaxID=884348 RepID=UPI00230213DD|nr:spermatogenesis-associated protein 45 [Hemicordylus capensis]